jgi:hypothetical protein
MQRHVRAFGILTGLLVLVGCQGAGADRQEVKGSVTFKGKPLPQGTIQFDPDPAGADARMAVTSIQAGQYDFPRASGLKPGTYKVIISSSAGAKVKEDEPPGESTEPSRERIPPDYNTATKQKVEVKAGGPNQFDFKIP